jgi:hypothetical protein
MKEKNMKSFALGILMSVLSSCASAQNIETAGYFRVWQGYQKADLTSDQFINALPSFMKETVDLYHKRALNNYIVIIPPVKKPAFVPDELALVALNSKENYDAIRATPPGQAYSARHWDVFNRENSKSLLLVNYKREKPEALVNNTSYDMLGEPINWAKGYNMVFIGVKKDSYSSQQFLARLKTHIEAASAALAPQGLLGYILVANENYEVAYLNWKSKAALDVAVFTDGVEFMDVLMYQEAPHFQAGQAVQPGQAYSTLKNTSLGLNFK